MRACVCVCVHVCVDMICRRVRMYAGMRGVRACLHACVCVCVHVCGYVLYVTKLTVNRLKICLFCIYFLNKEKGYFKV